MTDAPQKPKNQSPTSPGPSAEGPITVATIAAAERLAGLCFDPGERTQMLATIADQVALLRARRGAALEADLVPATGFDPRLPTTAPPRRARFRPPRVNVGRLPRRDADIAFAPLARLAGWLKRRRITSARLTELYLERLGTIGAALDCVITLTAERDRAEAARADHEIAAGRYLGPLHGVPWGAKDLLDTAGIATTWGAAPFRDRVPARDAAVIRLLDAAGAVLVAKTSLGALAWGDVWFGGVTRNPWHRDEGSSGSSAGSAAAVVAGLVGFALGSETHGSIVSPCVRCGATGLRPTFGRVPRVGAMTLAWSLDKIGPICRGVGDTALALRAINAHDPADPGSRAVPLAFDAGRDVAGARVGYDPAWFADAAEGERAALDALRRLGVDPVAIALPDLPYATLTLIVDAEAAAAFEALTLDGRDDRLVRQEPDAWPNRFRQARFIPAVDLIQAERLRRKAMLVMDDAFANLDAMIGPGLSEPMLTITNMTGHPSLTLRAGFGSRPARTIGGGGTAPAPIIEAPYGVTLWGRLYDEGTILNLGLALEAAFGVAERRPPLGGDPP